MPEKVTMECEEKSRLKKDLNILGLNDTEKAGELYLGVESRVQS